MVIDMKTDFTVGLNLKKIFDNSYDLLMVTDASGKVLMINNASSRLVGLGPEEIVGKNVNELIENGYYDRSIALEVVKNKKVETGLVKTGTGKNLMSTSVPVFNKFNEVELVITNTREQALVNVFLEELNEERKKYKNELNYFRNIRSRKDKLVYKSKCMKDLVDEVKRVAQYDSNILITGETGTGKDVIANFIHKNSNRSNESFIPVNCSAIPENLFESELFGYEQGAFSGANAKGKPGILEIANGGTLFLDEVSELPLAFQPKLLRVLETREIRRVGGTKTREIDIRIIVATNKNLRGLVKENKFREDLFFRLNVMPITIPPLRERKDDINPLIDYFLGMFNHKYGVQKKLSQRAIEVANDYHWPGNVRELKNVIERLMITSTDNEMQCRMDFRKGVALDMLTHSRDVNKTYDKSNYTQTLKEITASVEKEYLKNIMKQTEWKTNEAAEILGIHRSVLWRKIKEYQIDKDEVLI
ncbi:MAG: sigma 54-interacting transcriptional regulator [Eubacteriales bacterium]|nr:sigma 54-interacting transcriptional regulator [Eubacteriales bacterium]